VRLGVFFAENPQNQPGAKVTIVTNETFSAIFLQSHQQHHTAPEVALTVGSMLLKRKFRHLPLFKIVDFALKCTR